MVFRQRRRRKQQQRHQPKEQPQHTNLPPIPVIELDDDRTYISTFSGGTWYTTASWKSQYGTTPWDACLDVFEEELYCASLFGEGVSRGNIMIVQSSQRRQLQTLVDNFMGGRNHDLKQSIVGFHVPSLDDIQHKALISWTTVEKETNLLVSDLHEIISDPLAKNVGRTSATPKGGILEGRDDGDDDDDDENDNNVTSPPRNRIVDSKVTFSVQDECITQRRNGLEKSDSVIDSSLSLRPKTNIDNTLEVSNPNESQDRFIEDTESPSGTSKKAKKTNKTKQQLQRILLFLKRPMRKKSQRQLRDTG